MARLQSIKHLKYQEYPAVIDEYNASLLAHAVYLCNVLSKPKKLSLRRRF